jgi:formylglycine-generating enzyme required for sulfatase activity
MRCKLVPRPKARIVALLLVAPLIVLGGNAAAAFIQTVPIGNLGNAADPLTGNGSVGYQYRLGRTEVTVGQYTTFLNAVAANDVYGLYNTAMATDLQIAGINRTGVAGSYSYSVIGSPNKPIAYVSWGDAARFANWLHNGMPTGAQNASTTEDGAYLLNGATTDDGLEFVSRKAGATWFIPTLNEWYKGAYHQPAAQGGDADNYWSYAVRSNTQPFSDQPPGATPDNTKVANFAYNDGLANGYDDGFAVTGSNAFDPNQNYLTDVASYVSSSSYYGTFDQTGNLYEWNQATFFLGSDGYRNVRGGAWISAFEMDSAFLGFNEPTTEDFLVGFRMATTTVPEPSSVCLLVFGSGAISLVRLFRRR